MSSLLNNSNSVLTSNSTFTGGWEDVKDYMTANIHVQSDQNGSLAIQYSSNASDIDWVDTISHVADVDDWKQIPIKGRYLRCVYTNGSTNQLSFKLAVNYSKGIADNIRVALNSSEDSVSIVDNRGAAVYRTLDLDENGQVAHSGACKLTHLYFKNWNSGTRHLKIYDKSSAPNQTDTPVMNFTFNAYEFIDVDLSIPIVFSNGIGLRATSGIADDNTGGSAPNEVLGWIAYVV